MVKNDSMDDDKKVYEIETINDVEEWLIQWKGYNDTSWGPKTDIIDGLDDGVWEVEHIIKTLRNGSMYVKWKMFGKKFNSWVEKVAVTLM